MTRADYLTIETILVALESQYSSSILSTDLTLPIAYSKLAVLELGGWIEESVDVILYNYIDNRLLTNDCKDRIKSIIKKNNGFTYKDHVFHLFICTLGANNWENIVDIVGNSQISMLDSKFATYTEQRNKAAHTYQLVTPRYYAPSQVITDFRTIRPIMEKIEDEVIKLI